QAGATLVERRSVVAVAGIADLDVAEAGEEPAVPRVARRQYAVEHVDSGGDRFDQILGRAHAHQVPGLVRGESRGRVPEDSRAVLLRLADGEAADRVAVEADAFQLFQGFVAQGLVDAALDDPEQQILLAERIPRAPRPAHRKAHRVRRFLL